MKTGKKTSRMALSHSGCHIHSVPEPYSMDLSDLKCGTRTLFLKFLESDRERAVQIATDSID